MSIYSEHAKVTLEQQRLALEKERLRLERSFTSRHLGALITAVLSLAAVAVSSSQVWVAYVQRSKEIALKELESDRNWKLDALRFVVENQKAIFSGDIDESRRIRNVMLAVLPDSINDALFERFAATAPDQQKEIWQEGRQILRGDLPASVQWVRTSDEYKATVVQLFRLATSRVEQILAESDVAPGSWAVAADLDDTLLSSADYNAARAAANESFSMDSWAAWVETRSAEAVPGARDFLSRVRDLGGKIVVVTNRTEELCLASEDNLRSQELYFDLLLCRSAGEGPSKTERWQRVIDGTASGETPPLTIVMWIGDQIRDFPVEPQPDPAIVEADAWSNFGSRFILLPNPQYGAWEQRQ